jgi:hypothetical protein
MSLREQPNFTKEPRLTGTDAQNVPAISERTYQRSVFRRRKRWIPMPFGRYTGLTLPQVLFTDPDYFFWVRGILKGALAIEAEQVARRACRIRIPREPAEAFVVDYFFEPGGQFVCFSIVPKDKERHLSSHEIHRENHLDFSRIRNRRQYAKREYVRFLRCFRNEFFGNKSARMTRERCEGFFNGDNFVSNKAERYG